MERIVKGAPTGSHQVTVTGTGEAVIVPSPSSPEGLVPQHSMLPLVKRAQVCSEPPAGLRRFELDGCSL